jgi:hypothetical protein
MSGENMALALIFPAQIGAMVRAEGLEPSRAVKPCGFSYHFGFRRLAKRVRGLDYPFTTPPHGGLRCCPSSLYTFPENFHAFSSRRALQLAVCELREGAAWPYATLSLSSQAEIALAAAKMCMKTGQKQGDGSFLDNVVVGSCIEGCGLI